MKASGCGWIILFQYLFVTLLGEEHCWIEESCGNMMKYVKHNESDGTITIDAIPIPSLKDGDILIKVHAAGVNRLDLLQVQGRYPPPPGDSNILGVEVAGTVEKLSFSAQSSTTLKEGDRVMALIGGGGYAEYAVVPYQCVMSLPDGISYIEGAAIPEVYITAYQALIWNAQLKDGSTVLIHAGASGVGLAAIQLAKTLRENVNVIATTRSSEKVPICIENGADLVILTAEKNFSEEVMKFTNGRGADVILDFVGGSYWEKNINCLASDSHLILLAMLGGSMTQSNVDLGQMLRKRLTIKGSTLRSRSIEYKGKLISEFSNEVIPLFISKRCWPTIDTYFTIDEVSKAHERMKQNINKGKIVLTVQSVLF